MGHRNGHSHPSPFEGSSWFGQLSWLGLWTIPFHGRHGEVSSASQQTAWLGLWTTHHGNSAWTLLCLHGGIKDILWLNCHFLGPTIGFQYGQHLFNPVVCLLDHLWWLGPLQSLFGRQPWLQIISTNALAEPPWNMHRHVNDQKMMGSHEALKHSWQMWSFTGGSCNGTWAAI